MALGRKSKGAVQRTWRPDFRDVQNLPDTKVIRTDFLVNFVAIAFTLIVITIYAFKEYSLQTVSRDVHNLEEQVATHSNANRQLLNQNKRFIQNSDILEEVIAFDREVLDLPTFIVQMSSVIPNGVVLSTIELRSNDSDLGKDAVAPMLVELTGRVTASSDDTPSQILDTFQASLFNLETTTGRELEADLIRFNRNNEFGHFDFTLRLHIPLPEQSSS